MKSVLNSVSTCAPGKVILCGEHAVVYGKEAIACSVNLKTSCTLKVLLAKKGRLIIYIPKLCIENSFRLEDLQQLQQTSSAVCSDATTPSLFDFDERLYNELLSTVNDDMKRNALKMITSLFVHIANKHLLQRDCGLHMVFNTELPIGGGLGSSASFAVSTASALLVLTGILDRDQKNWTEENYKLINDWAFQAEKIVHGTPSGIDNSVSTYGQCVSFKAGTIDRLNYLSFIEMNVLVVDTRKKRSTKDLVTGVKKRKQQVHQVSDTRCSEQTDRLGKFIRFNNQELKRTRNLITEGWMEETFFFIMPDVYNSLMNSIESVTNHFKMCLQNISDGVNIDQSFTEIEDLVDINQNLLNAIGVGHSCINDILKICASVNLHGKLTGAGGGGCVFAIVPESFPVDKLKMVREKLNVHYNSWLTCLGGPGVVLKDVNHLQIGNELET